MCAPFISSRMQVKKRSILIVFVVEIKQCKLNLRYNIEKALFLLTLFLSITLIFINKVFIKLRSNVASISFVSVFLCAD